MSDSPRIRRSIVRLALLGILLTYATQAVFDRKAFADRAVRSLRGPAVAGLLADRISLAAISVNRDLTAYRPLI